MTLAEKLCHDYGLISRGTDIPKESAIDAIEDAIERAAQECENGDCPWFDGNQKCHKSDAAKIRALLTESVK